MKEQLLSQVAATATRAGHAILSIYQQDFSVSQKADASPLTSADLAAHDIIVTELAQYSDLPILSEESAAVPWRERQTWRDYWLVDPLDGTKEFIKKNGEFTVNIALISNGKPVLGVVYAPVLDTLYAGSSAGAIKRHRQQQVAISAVPPPADGVCKVVGSRSHQNPEIDAFLAATYPRAELLSMGSSLKLCLVAEGAAHVYPRLGPTSEWDTAAAHAVVAAAGGKVTILDRPAGASAYTDTGAPLLYNQRESLLNPYFLVSA